MRPGRMESHSGDVRGHRADDAGQEGGTLGSRGHLLFQPWATTTEEGLCLPLAPDEVGDPETEGCGPAGNLSMIITGL